MKQKFNHGENPALHEAALMAGERLMSARGRVREFSSPISEFRKSASESEAAFLERLKRVSMQQEVRMNAARQKLHNESYAYPAAGIGAGVGLGAGALATLPTLKKLPKGMRRVGLPVAVGMGLAGSLIGSLGGLEIGGRIRRNQDKNLSANLKPALRELAARSGRIVEFGDGGADEAVLGALKAVASAGESPAQRAMLLKQGLIEMVKGQVVITERGYEMMQKAGMPPKLTPEERREEIAGTEEKRLSMFDHRGHREHRVEFAQGQYVAGLLGVKNPVRIHKTQRFFPTNGPVRDQIAQNARKIRGIDQVKGESLRKALQPKRDKLVKSTKDIYQKQKRGAVASMNSDSQDIQGWVGSQNYYSPLARKTKEVRAAYGLSRFDHGHGGHGVELARGDYALASAEGVLSKLNPAFSLARSRSLTLGGAKAVAARVPRRGTAEVKKLADAVRWHRNNRKLALKNLPHNVNSEQGIFEKLYEGYHY